MKKNKGGEGEEEEYEDDQEEEKEEERRRRKKRRKKKKKFFFFSVRDANFEGHASGAQRGLLVTAHKLNGKCKHKLQACRKELVLELLQLVNHLQ